MISSIKKLVISNSDFIYIICTFIVMLSLSSFTLGNNSEQEIMLALIWICATFALQISTGNLFASDYHDGILEQIFIQPLSSKFIIAYKIFAHWILFGVPISVISSIFNFVILDNGIEYSIITGLSLLLNMLIVINISATGSALMIGRNNLTSGMPQILVLPVIMPAFVYFKLLIQFEGLSLNAHILLITALVFTILLVNSAIATHMALKFAVEQD
ncbi:heme exporter protein CcmB [Wolbachia endosymbiont of Dirofilaria (Dirofilaria) immitis]|uniref:heme exporter protein CcmB n=1 Tax=Wolbachia endosymbiont of Dirofilaria (Dirofilaria) immitis TaxID=1812115 RepID=UPI00158B32AD|nr:heme exporter protein CcmB [Wolbachia endosymbiont of Dirofilaria (Dirofilaria) immitis]QKX02134.1 transcriptional regulator [Wolbachia endosymbiont of Dirofilaria (Dirofilaria) immitis]